jgi:hypothetical protein
MKKIIVISSMILSSIFAVGFISYENKQDDKNNAYTWAYKACDKSKGDSAFESAANAARANSLDHKWLRLSDAANELAGADSLSKMKVSYAGASGNDAISVALKIYTMSAQFAAECSLTFKVPESE